MRWLSFSACQSGFSKKFRLEETIWHITKAKKKRNGGSGKKPRKNNYGTPDVNKAQEQEAKTAFMDEEIKKLKIRYQNEKEEITAKYVAEQSAGCYGKKA